MENCGEKDSEKKDNEAGDEWAVVNPIQVRLIREPKRNSCWLLWIGLKGN